MDFITLPRSASAGRSSTPRTSPVLEALESRRLMAASISGSVYDDANDNGFIDSGEGPLRGSALELRNSAGTVVATAVSDANGRYEFTVDRTIGTAPDTRTVVVSFDPARTGWTRTMALAQFDPSLGTLTGITITNRAQLDSQILLENLDEEPGSITGTVNGTITISGAGLSPLAVRLSATDSFSAPMFDGSADLEGPGSRDSGQLTRTGSQSVTLTSAADLARFTGTGTVTLTGRATARGTADGPGNLLVQTSAVGSAQVEVIYRYIPNNCLRPGNYTIVQTGQPSGYLDGKDAAAGAVLPNSIHRDVIPVTLGTGPVINNNFGEVRPGVLSGYVYLDLNNNGLRDPGESTGFGGLAMVMTGVNDIGVIGAVTAITRSDGFYIFPDMRPGRFTVTEVGQPAGFVSGMKTRGNVAPLPGSGSLPDVIPDIVINPGTAATENNFGKLVVVGPPVPPLVVPTGPSKVNLLSDLPRFRRRT